MACMSGNDKCPSGDFGDSLQLTNWILDSGATCHMILEVSYFIPGLLEDTDKHIEVADGHHVTAKKSTSTNKNVRQTWRSFHRNVTQRTFGTRFMEQVIFNR